jgi:cyanophycinase
VSHGAAPGPVALVGSGEYLPVMLEVEGDLIAGRPPRYVQLPTAAGEEGPRSIARWVALGAQQAERLGVQAAPVMVLDRESAEDEAHAAEVAGAGLIYLSGGSPAHLADSLRGTRVWTAILETWQRGAALAGCSAGAMALSAAVPDIRHPRAESRPGLGVVPGLMVIPHFDRMARWAPWLAASVARRLAAGVALVGIEEETAMVSDGTNLDRWTVRGRQRAWVVTPTGRTGYADGEEILLHGPGPAER